MTNNSQIDKYIKPIIKTYLTSVSRNEYGLSNLKTKQINEFLNVCTLEDMKSVSDLYQKLRTASWNKNVEMMHFLIKCIESITVVHTQTENA